MSRSPCVCLRGLLKIIQEENAGYLWTPLATEQVRLDVCQKQYLWQNLFEYFTLVLYHVPETGMILFEATYADSLGQCLQGSLAFWLVVAGKIIF